MKNITIDKFNRLNELIGFANELVHSEEDFVIENEKNLNDTLHLLNNIIPRLEKESGYKIEIKISK